MKDTQKLTFNQRLRAALELALMTVLVPRKHVGPVYGMIFKLPLHFQRSACPASSSEEF